MDKHLKAAAILAKLLDNQFKIGRFRFGLDPLLGLIPGIGDVLPLLLSLYIIWIASEARVPSTEISKMVTRVIFDFFLGLFPVIGDLSDFMYKANSRNLETLRKYQPEHTIEGETVEG